FGIALWPPFSAAVLEIADQFFLLGVDGDHRIAGRLVLCGHAGDVVELGITISMLPAFPRLAGRLQAVVELCQKVTNAPLADLMPQFGQILPQSRRARRISASARRASGMVQSVQVVTTVS